MSGHKIVHLITSLKVGGAETILYDLLRNLDNNIFQNYVIYFHEGPNIEKIEKLGIQTYKINGIFCNYDPVFLVRLFFKIKKISPACIHSSLWSANILGTLIGKLLNIPVICVLHLATNFESKSKNSFFRNILDKIFLPMANNIVVVSNSMINDMKKFGCNWVESNKIKLITNSIDTEHIKSLSNNIDISRKNLNIKDDAFVIGNVGRFIPRKNHKLLISSFSLLLKIKNNVHLILIGYGSEKDNLIEQAKDLNIYDKITIIETSNAYAYYKLFDCFVLTSVNESFGLVVLESMAFGVPCIVTHDTDNHEIIINNINGFLVDFDPAILSYKLEYIINNKDLRDKISDNAYNMLLKNFDIKVMTKKYERALLDNIQSNIQLVK